MILSKIVSTVLLSTPLGMSVSAADNFCDHENLPFSRPLNASQTRSVEEIKEHLNKSPNGTISESEFELILEPSSQISVFDKDFFAKLSTQNLSNGNQSLPIIDWCQKMTESTQNDQLITLDSPNNAKASFFLGIMALYGIGTAEKDPLTAAFYFGSSLKSDYEHALMGYCHALIQQGNQRSHSSNHSEDYGRAIKLIKNAARKGSHAALHAKARLLNTGFWNMPRDPKKAAKILKTLVKSGYQPASKDLEHVQTRYRTI